MPALKSNPMPWVGVDMFYWAPLVSDKAPAGATPGATTYGAAQRVPGLTNVSFTANSQTGSYYADNGVYATAAQLGELGLAVQSADIPPELRAEWFQYDYEDGVLNEAQINPIEMAVGYRRKRSDGSYRYVWLLKVKPGMSDEATATQNDSIAFQDGTTNFAPEMRISDGLYRRTLDDDDPALPEDVTPEVIAANWFTDPNWDPAEYEEE